MKDCEYLNYLKHLQTLNDSDLRTEGRRIRSEDRRLEMITSKLYWWIFVTITSGILGGLLQFMNRAIDFFGPKIEISTIYTIAFSIIIGHLIIFVGFFIILWQAYNSVIEKHIIYDDYCENMKNHMNTNKEKHGE